MEIAQLRAEFFSIYDNRTVAPVIFFCPGRVNLIGEHTDYNNGFVLPCALNYGTYLLVRKRKDDRLIFNTLNFKFNDIQSINKISKNRDGEWVNYPLGIIAEFIERGITPGGLEMLFYGDIPNGAGLSSSASIEMVTAFALNELWDAGLSLLEMVKLSQHAENTFVGMNCGIMDQFAVGMGKKDSAIFLNCGTLNYDTIPFELGDYRLVISNTSKRRGLTDSKYNERRAECEKAVSYLSARTGIEHLSQLSIEDLHLLDECIPEETIRKRARHVISENNRVLQAVRVLHEGDILSFGRLMNESHDSLRDDYDVTGKELDAIVYEARKISGTIGSRMTGAGFGGCSVSLVEDSKADSFIDSLQKAYFSATGLEAEFYLPSIVNGVRQLENH